MKMNHHAHDPNEPPNGHVVGGKTDGFSFKSDPENRCAGPLQRHTRVGCNIHLDETGIECP